MPEVIIIGTGFSGLGMAIQLKRQGRDDFVLLEKADDIGGTWRDNSYPGCACDVPSHMHSYSFEPTADWSRAYSRQPEIWDYLKELTEKYSLREHIRFGEEVTSAKWSGHEWAVGTAKGEYRGQFLVAGVGALHIPNIPELPGIERFEGHTFHSANWDHGYDLHGKRIAVVGTGASAIQFVPEIAGEVAELHLHQRTAPWVLPRGNGRIKESTKRLFERIPLGRKAYRNVVYWAAESLAIGFNGHPGILKVGEYFGKRHIAKQIADPELRRKVTPDYTLGCKRVLGSNKYYRALTSEVRPSVQAAFNDEIQRKLASGVWSTGGCTSWYLDSHGVNRTIWPGFTWQYWLRTRKVDTGDFELTGSRARKLTGVA